MNIKCSKCGSNVGNVNIPDNTTIRAYIMCPECIEKEPDYDEEINLLKKENKELIKKFNNLQRRLKPINNLKKYIVKKGVCKPFFFLSLHEIEEILIKYFLKKE